MSAYHPIGYPPPSSGPNQVFPGPRLVASVIHFIRTLPRIAWFAIALLAFLGLGFTSHKASPETLPALSTHLTNSVSAYQSSLQGYLARLRAGAQPSVEMTYRQHIESTTSPKSQIEHHPTMGFDHIYVLSLPSRLDRREEMSKLGSALGVKITFVDAALKSEPFIQWIAERVAEQRESRSKILSKYRKVHAFRIGGLHMGSDWLTPWLDDKLKTPFPAFPEDARYPEGDWVAHLEANFDKGTHLNLQPSDPNVNITELLWDDVERVDVRQVHEGIISTWWGQTRAMRLVVKNDDKSALIMEDDVDVEWDLERLWSRIRRRLPGEEGGSAGVNGTWDSVFLGHCWGHELSKPAYLHPILHQTSQPMCLHGYALSATGARKLFGALQNPWSAFASAVDLAVPTFIDAHELNSFSLQPPLIIQRKDGPSDLQKGQGSKWRGLLRDSTVERIAQAEGVDYPTRTLEQSLEDPANQLRCDL